MAWIALAAVSLATAVVMLLVVRATSDQRRIARVKRSIRAGLFEIRLFNDDPRAILRAQRDLLRDNLTYVWLALPPLLWLAVPLVVLTAQLHFSYGYAGLEPGRSAIVTAQVDRERLGDASPRIALEAPSGLRVETPAVWVPSLGEAAWRISAERAGVYDLTVRAGDTAFAKRIHVDGGIARLSPARLRGGLVNRLLFSAETPLPGGSPLRSISVAYPGRTLGVGGWRLHWIIVYVGLTMVFVLLLKRRLRVVL